MQYQGPAPVDFDDVHALNRAFLALLPSEPNAGLFLAGLRDDLAARLCRLTPGQTERLAAAPFLLFSLRDGDRRFWQELQAPAVQPTLFAQSDTLQAPGRLIAAAAGFVWQLARQNPYALRLVCGASLHWCESLAEQPLVHIIERLSARDDLLTLRAAADSNVWDKLLTGGVTHRENLRVASQLSALQMMLTGLAGKSTARWPAAACRTRFPSLSVAEDSKD
jgi:hypothetical protein